MHLTIINIINWFQFILHETILEYYEHTLHKILSDPDYQALFQILGEEQSNVTDCYDPSIHRIKAYTLGLKAFMIPASIEFSITCATIFLIAWSNIGKRNKNLTLPPMKEDLEGVGKVKIPLLSLYVMLDCTKTSRGIFYGILVVTFTLVMFVLCLTETDQRVLSEFTELALVFIALIVTAIAFYQIKKHYTKVKPVMNMFDVVLIIVGLCGVFSYNINSLIALSDFGTNLIYLKDNRNATSAISSMSSHGRSNNNLYASDDNDADDDPTLTIALKIVSILNAVIGMAQGTLQTAFILECLKRFAMENKQFFRKPARDLIILLLSKY